MRGQTHTQTSHAVVVIFRFSFVDEWNSSSSGTSNNLTLDDWLSSQACVKKSLYT